MASRNNGAIFIIPFRIIKSSAAFELLLLSSYLKMAPLLREAINRKKQHLMTKLIRSGFYQNHVQELSGYTLHHPFPNHKE
jgi:hypothetical protein